MKHVCISLAAALALAVPSFAQSAEETPFSCEVRTKFNQAGTSYSSVAEAVAAVPTDGKIHYVYVVGEGPAEITTPITVTAGQNISLCSEKSGITYDIPASLTAPVFTVESGARLTFTKSGKYVYGEGVQGTFLENYGDVSIASGTFTLDAGESGVAIINHGGAEDNSMKCGATVTVASGTAFLNDGALTLSGGTTTAEAGVAVVNQGGTLTLSTSKGVTGSEGAIVVNGGVAKFTKGSYASTSAAPAVRLCAAAAPIEAVFSSSSSSSSVTLTAAEGDALAVDGAARTCEIKVNNGTFAPAEGKASIRVTHDTEDADITLSVVDGVFKAPIVSEGSAPVGGFILGGSFVESPDAALVADGLTFEKNADGFYAPTAAAVAQIGDATYLTFKEAIVAATPGATVKLLRDVSIPESTPITVYGLTVDLGGHTLINTATGGSGIRLTLSNAEGTPADFKLVGPGSVVAATPLYASGSDNYARPYTVIVDESVILKSTVEGNPQIELSGSARVAATDANVTRLGQGGFKVKDGDAEWLYGNCAGAFLNTPEGGTFTLCQDFSGPSRLEFSIDPALRQSRAAGIVKTATLDLAGHAFTSTLDRNGAELIVVDSGANVTIKGGTLAAIGDLAHMALPDDNNGNAALTLEDVTATSSSDDYLIVSNGSTDNINITVRDSTLTATGANTVAIFAPAGGDSIVTLDNAIIKSPYGVQVCAGDLFVKGNTQITTTAANVASTKTGDGPIPDGAAISIVDRAGYGDDATTGSSIGTVTIEGTPTLIAQGEGATAVAAYTWNDNTQSDWAEASEHVAISGGTFNRKPDDALLAPDFVLVENQDGTFDVVSAYVASIGDMKYADFKSFFTAFQAIAASETPTTVTLLADLTGDRAVPGVVPVLAGQNIVFDLNGHTMETTLKEEGRHHYAIDNYGTLTIKDSSTEQTGTIRARGVENLDNGKLTIESGTIVSVDANGGACIWNEADVTVKGGTFTTEFVGTPSDEFAPGCLNNSGTALVTGGTFHNVNRRTYAIISNTGSIEITPAEGSEVTVFGAHGGLGVDGGTAVVNGGTYSSSDYYGLYVSNDGLGEDPMQAAVTVNDGTFDGKTYSVWVGSDYNNPVNSTIAIKGGTFLKPLHRQSVSRHNALQVSGGTFAKPVDLSYCADGYIPKVNAETGTYGVTGGTYVAAIETAEGVAGYEALQAAFDAATEGQTVTLIADVDCSEQGVKVAKSVTFDLNGRTLSLANIGTGNLNIAAGATLTLVDSTDTEKKGTGSGKIVATHDYASGYTYGIINVSDGAAFVMESGLIDTVRETPVNNGQFGVMVSKTGTATINGGHIRAGWYAIAGNGKDKTEPGTTIAVNGGILESTADYAIYHPQAGTLSIAGGTVAGAAGGLSIHRGTATITGGTVTSKGTGDTGDWPDGTSGQGNAAITVGAAYGDVALDISGEATVTAPDGTPAISVPDSANAQDIAISGGTFSEKPDNAWFADGYIPVKNEDGTFGVAQGSFAAEIAGEKYLTLKEAIAAVPENGAEATTIMLLDDVTSAGSLTLTNGQKAILNVNGKTVTFTSGKLQLLTSASLTLTGEGALVCQSRGTGAISIYGNETSQIDLLVDSGVTVDGHYGIVLFGNGAPACRNVTVTVKGTVKTSEGGSALYVNGTVNDLEGPVPQITLAEGATVEAVSVGIYAAGYAKWDLAGTINADYAITIKSGDFTITGGSYTSTGNFVDPAEANSNGTEDTGAAISITTNPDYAQKTNVTITGGTFTSTNGYAFYEGIAVKDGQPIAEASTAVIAITGGTFVGNAEKGPIMIATAKDKQVITGGYFSAMPPTEFLADGVVSIKDATAPENAPVALRQFAAQCGTTVYQTLRDAIIQNQRSDKYGQTITLLRNVTEPQVIQVGETLIANATDSNVIVDLNGKTVTFEDKGAFQITEKGSLTLTGSGKVLSKTADGDVVRIFGSQNDVANECVLNVGKDVTLEGEVGIAVYKGYPDETKCLGVNVTVEGTIISHSSFAAYINGSNKTTTGNVPTFSFTGTSKIQADTVAVYAAGYGKWIFAGNVTAGDDALSIKCGDITITGGTYMAKGEFNDPADANGNGTEETGAAVSITTNSAYAPKTNVTITGGTFISENGYAFYEGIAKKADGTPAAEASTAVISITNGTFTGSKTNESVTADIAITTAENKQVVSGGTFSQAVPEAFCAPGYAPKQNADGTYSVVGWYETGVDTNDDGVADAWTIRNEGDLAAFRDKVNSTVTFAGCTVTLTADLDLSDMGTWIPIGEGNAGGASKNGGFFAGTFEGGNHLIANLHVSETKPGEGAGLFGWVRGATIRNLRVSGSFLANVNGAAGIIGVVESNYDGNARTVIENVHNKGDTVRGSKAGGIVGDIRRGGTVSITNCTNAAAVTASINHSDTAGVLCAGGIVGNAGGTSVTIAGCTNTGTVTATPDDEGLTKQTPTYAGGIVGRMGTGSIAAGNGGNTGTVSATGAGTAGQGAILGGVVAGTQPVLDLALTEADAEAGRVALFTAAEVVPEGLTVTVAPAEGAFAPAGTVLAVDDGTLYCNLLYLANRVAGESEGETFNAAAQEALLAAAGNTLYGTIAVTGTTAGDKALTTAQVNEVLACFEGEGLITASESEGVKTLVVAYDFGITGLRVTAEGDLVVTVAAQDAQAKPLAFAEGVTFALRNGEDALETTSATVADGVTTLTVPAANLPAGNLELTISVALAAETPVE